MRASDRDCIRCILNGKDVLDSAKVRFSIGVGGLLTKGRLTATPACLLLKAKTPMGIQVAVVHHSVVEHMTFGKKEGAHYLQLLGNESRVLVVFKSKEVRNRFQKLLRQILQ